MGIYDTSVFIVRKASVWLCDSGRSEYTGYLKSISPLGFTAALRSNQRPSDTIDSTNPAGQPIPDPCIPLLGHSFVAAICGKQHSALVDAVITDVRKLSGSSFDCTFSCRFKILNIEQKRAIVGLIIEHYAPPSAAG